MEKKNKHSTSRDLQDFQEDVGALLPWHQLWAATLLGRVNKESLDEELKRTQNASKSAAGIYHRDEFQTSNEIALLWMDVLHKLDALDAVRLAAFTHWKDELQRPLFTPTLTALARLCGQKEATKQVALAFALEAFNLTKDDRSGAESQSEGYIDAARAILAVSKADAEAYFNEAVEVASKIGDENLARWDAILDLADRAARVDRPVPVTAYRFARSAELTYHYVDRDKHFDWHATIEALCGLCPSSALAILSRWRDRGFGWSERILPIAIARLVELDKLDARDALSLIGFRAQWNYAQLLDSVLAKSTTRDEKETATHYLYRYLQFSGGNFSKLKEIISRHSVTIVGLDETVAFYEAEARANRDDEPEQVVERDDITVNPSRNWNDVFAGCNLTTAAGLSRAYAAFKATEVPWYHDQFFKEAIRRVPVGSEADFIEAIGNTPEFDLYHLRNFLEAAPDTWRDRPATAHALSVTLKAFCRRYCMGITKNRHYEVLPFKTACALAGISEAEIVSVVLDAVGQTPDLAGFGRLFSLVGLLAIKLSEDEALDALEFGLDLFNPALEDKDADGPWSNQLAPPSDIKVSLAGYIWAAMAAPEAVLRWEGAHAVLGLAALRRDDVLSHVVNFAQERKGGPFVDAKLPFYDLHALQWLLIAIARAAMQFPAALAPFANQIVDWALKEQPHVMNRLFASRAALALMDNGILVDRDQLKELLARVNVSPLPVIESRSYDRRRPKEQDTTRSADDRYYFGIDFGPYWYEPLGRVFALSQEDIEIEALKVIRSAFAFTGTARWDEDERSRRKLYEENHTYHSHGSHPRADTLHFYHAYHAMMIVAGKLLAIAPTHRNSEYGEENEFADWLDRHDLSRKDGHWLWDRRDPTPLERFSWQDRKKDDPARHDITVEDFDEALRAGDTLNVWGYWTTAASDREQSAHIYSALVSPDKSLALLRALGTAKDVHDYAIPSADSDMEIDEYGFSLKGWMIDRTRDRGLDGQDRWSGGITFPPPIPAPYIIDAMHIDADSDYRLWKNTKNSVAMASQVWGHYDEAKRHESANPERGSRIQATLGFLAEMLAKLDRDLIIEVQIDRRRRSRSYESGVDDDKERIPTKARLYLLGTDGQIRTL